MLQRADWPEHIQAYQPPVPFGAKDASNLVAAGASVASATHECNGAALAALARADGGDVLSAVTGLILLDDHRSVEALLATAPRNHNWYR